MLGNKQMPELTGGLLPRWWHPLYTRHQHEKVVIQALSCKGFEVFLLQYQTVHRWKDRRKKLTLPLFPNYLFIRAGLNRMVILVTTPGIHSLVCCGGRPANIPPEEIKAVRRLVESALPVKPHPFLKYGDRARIKSGLPEGIEGILVRKTRGVRLVLSAEMLSKSAAVEEGLDMVERLPNAQRSREGMQRSGLSSSPARPHRPYAAVAV